VPGVRHGRARSVQPRIARRGAGSSEKLGRQGWVVERTFARLNRLRRLTVRYERRADIHEALTLLGCALVCLDQIARRCWCAPVQPVESASQGAGQRDRSF
jgi:transposase